jgi:LytS/YehU family sensor histidine kinase
MAVFRSDFTEPSFLDVPLIVSPKTKCSLINNPGIAPQLAIDNGSKKFLVLYRYNPLYYLRWLIYSGLFLAVYLLILLIAHLQRIRIVNHLKTEKKITELQLKIVRNQMDPHFTMNAINAVVDAINREEKEQARDNLLHFSKMYRSLVLSADKIKRSLREEIDFTENYLALEKFRFGNRFNYKIELGPGVDLGWEVPKMVIQSPVENAVKHGLQMRDEGGEIRITTRKEDGKLILEISDNGIGRNASAIAGKTSTGKGMEIMEQFFELYHKITGIRVQSTVTDLQDDKGNATGTKVVVNIPLS